MLPSDGDVVRSLWEQPIPRECTHPRTTTAYAEGDYCIQGKFGLVRRRYLARMCLDCHELAYRTHHQSLWFARGARDYGPSDWCIIYHGHLPGH